MNITLADLLRLADAATPGEREWKSGLPLYGGPRLTDEIVGLECTSSGYLGENYEIEVSDEDRAFIRALSPERIVALVLVAMAVEKWRKAEMERASGIVFDRDPGTYAVDCAKRDMRNANDALAVLSEKDPDA